MKRLCPILSLCGVLAFVGLLGGCSDGGASLELTLYSPSRDEQRPFEGVRFMRVLVSARDSATGRNVTRAPEIFDVSAGLGRLTNLPLSSFVSVVVEGLGSDSAPIARGYAPPVDLLAGAAVKVPVLFAQVDRFAGNVGVADSVRADLTDQRVGHTSTLLKDGRVLIAGGAVLSAEGGIVSPLSAAELYEPATGKATPLGGMGFARAFHTATLLKDGRVLVAGGISLISNSLSAVATAELFDPSVGRFKNTAGLLETRGRVSHSASLLADGRVLLAGGWGEGAGQRAILDSAEVFDPNTGRYSSGGNLRIARASHTATLLYSGRVLIVGGRSPTGALATTEIFDAARAAFVDGPTLPGEPRAGHAAVRMGSGLVLIAGGCSAPEPLNNRPAAGTGSGCHAVEGQPSPAGSALKRVDVYDPDAQDGPNGAFRAGGAAGDLQVERAEPSLTLLPGEARVLVVGGLGKDGATTSLAELIEESGGQYPRRRVAGEMRIARVFHAATRLASGLVLISGGSARSGASFSVLNALELYVP